MYIIKEMKKLIINECFYNTHPIYVMHAVSQDGFVFNSNRKLNYGYLKIKAITSTNLFGNASTVNTRWNGN